MKQVTVEFSDKVFSALEAKARSEQIEIQYLVQNILDEKLLGLLSSFLLDVPESVVSTLVLSTSKLTGMTKEERLELLSNLAIEKINFQESITKKTRVK